MCLKNISINTLHEGNDDDEDDDDDNNNKLQLGCHPVGVVILYAYRT